MTKTRDSNKTHYRQTHGWKDEKMDEDKIKGSLQTTNLLGSHVDDTVIRHF